MYRPAVIKNILITLFLLLIALSFTPQLVKADPGIPSTDPNYSQDVETWWGTHPMNPDNASGYSIGYVPNPPTVIEVAPDGGCGSGTSIQDALDNLPAIPTQGYTIQLEAGTYCGDVHLTNDYAESGASFIQTLKRDNIHFLGDPDGDTILKVSHHYAPGEYELDWEDREEFEILGCPESADYTGFSGARNPASDLHEKSNHCIQNPIKNIYVKDIIFDGDATSHVIVHLATARDVVMDNVTIRNSSGNGSGTHDGSLYGIATITNFWCRGCTFDADEEYQSYLDGLHGGGIIYSNIGRGTATGGLLYLTNDDFTRDRDGDGDVEENEWGVAQFVVNYKNTFEGKEGSSYNAISMMAADSLVKGNLVNGKVTQLVYSNPKSTRIVQYGGVTPSIAELQYTGNIIAENTVRSANYIAYIDQASDVCNPTDNASTYNADKCATVGDNTIRDNQIYSHTNAQFVREGWETDYDGADLIIPSTLSGNCASGGQFDDGETPGSSGNPHPAVSTTTACSTAIPVGPTNSSDNLVTNASFETVTSFPTNWQQRASASSDISEFFSGTKSLKLTGAASSVYVNYTGNLVPLLEGNTDYFINARVKATTIQTTASSFARVRFIDLTNGSTQTGTANINKTANYWQYITMKMTTAASTASVRLDILHTLEVGDAIYVDDIEFYKVSNHSQSISLPSTNDATSPTGSITGPTTTTSQSPTLALSGSDNFDSSTNLHMQISENSDFSGASWQWYSSTPIFNLSAGTGIKNLYVRFRDVHQNISPTYSLILTVTTQSENNSQPSSSSQSSNQETSCNAISPAGIPNLFQIDTNNTKAILHISKPTGETNKYLISYGLTDKTTQFTTIVDVNQSSWITPVIINELTPNTTYYFKTQAIKDCAYGGESKTVSAKTSRSASTTLKNFPNSKITLTPQTNSKKLSPTIQNQIKNVTKPPVIADVPIENNNIQPQITQPPTPSNNPNPPTQSWFGQVISSIKKVFGF